MPCFYPLQGFQARKVNPSGLRSVVFQKSRGFADREQVVSCGRCIGCRRDEALSWSVRAWHEYQVVTRSCALTLTYSEDNCPRSISIDELQRFFKRLRKNTGADFRYLACGEYGEDLHRPHYHVCLFGFDFSADHVFYKRSANGSKLYNSAELSKSWGLGHAVEGEMTFSTACYVAGYVTKKVAGSPADPHYDGRDAEFRLSSTRPALGRRWFERYWRDCMNDEIILPSGGVAPLPKYYVDLLERISPDDFIRIRNSRSSAARDLARSGALNGRILDQREKVAKSKLTRRGHV